MSEEIRVLIVEDEGPVRALLHDYLQSRGFEVQGAASGEEALALLSGEHFDLVLSDLRMPGINGMDLLSEIRRRHSGVGVVMLTGCEDVSLAVSAMKAGALDYVLKPFRLENVEASVRRALEKHGENRRQSYSGHRTANERGQKGRPLFTVTGRPDPGSGRRFSKREE